MKNCMVLPASALTLLLLLTQCGSGRAQASTLTSFCNSLYNSSAPYFSCDFVGDGNDDDFMAWIDYGCGQEDGGKNISVASNVHCTVFLERGVDFDTTGTCAAFADGFDFTEFLQEVEASAVICASGMPPIFTYTEVLLAETQFICDDTRPTVKIAVPTWTTSVEFDKTMIQIASFRALRKDTLGCSINGGDGNAPSGGGTPGSSGGGGTPGSDNGGAASSNAPTMTMAICGFVPWMLCIVVAVVSANIMVVSF